MSARTDLADNVVRAIASRFLATSDPVRRAALFRLGQASVHVWRAVYLREARLSGMRSEYRRRRR